jgi:CubicO group peptidase (beta-lactamase class C family)
MHHDGNVRIDGAPSVAASGNGDRDVYARHNDGTVLHKFWNNQKHSNAQEVPENANNSAWIEAATKIETAPGKPGLAVAVIKNGRIAHLAGYGTVNLATGAPVTSETMFHTGSCGKLLTALGIMMLKERGKLNYDDHLGKHIPELKDYPAGVTLRRMMQHMSGILDLYAALGNASSPPTNATVVQTAVAKGCPMDPQVIGPGA